MTSDDRGTSRAARAERRPMSRLRPLSQFGRRVEVLYVEDAAGLRPHVIAALDASRFHVVVAAGTHAAQFHCQRDRFEVVLCGTTSTARALWEFLAATRTRVLVASEGEPDATLPPNVSMIGAPESAGALRDAVLASARR
ncbi:MAG: hypothetical protein HYV09_03980 [Deltaproteobacteria bacterium]|nr:hypothetical protein [Deltaproteobacteria bacterium]